MSSGIFSTLETFEDGLGGELAEEGYDIWTIEMNGGPQIECTTCPDYTYQDQVDYFWPILVAGAMEYSGKSQVDYIGHSNGCRVALSSLNSYSNGKNNAGYIFNTETGKYDTFADLPNRPVDKFFGIACPATLNDETPFTLASRYNNTNFENQQSKGITGHQAIYELNQSGLRHIEMHDYAMKLSRMTPHNYIVDIVAFVSKFQNDKISLSLMDFYNDLSVNTSSSINLSSFNVSKIFLFNGKPTDLIVGITDQISILNASPLLEQNELNESFNGPYEFNHVLIKDKDVVKKSILRRLKE
jgi:hypothetical protein